MFSFRNWLRKVVDKLLPRQNLEKQMHVEIAESTVMDNAIQLWRDMYENHPPWEGKNGVALSNIPATIAEEMARLVMTEFTMNVTGSPFAEFVNEQFERELEDLDTHIEKFCAKGGIALKPYVSVDANGIPSKIEIDVVEADRFYPTEYNSKGEVMSAIFVQHKRMGEYLYTRLEYHKMVGSTITIVNKAFRSEKINSYSDGDELTVDTPLKDEVPLSTVAEWAGLSEEPVTINEVDRPLFVYIKVPKANTIDRGSPLGVSVYARAVDLIKEADKMLGQIYWEYDSKETAIHASAEFFDTDEYGKPLIPDGNERLYRAMGDSDNKALFDVYSPAIRESELFNGLNKILRKIEWNVGFAYGTLSDPDVVARTATEIKSSKQRSYRLVSRIQSAWGKAFEHLAESIRVLNLLYGIVPDGEIEVNIGWGDGILEDANLEYQRRWQMVMANKLKPEKFMAWYFGCSEDEALELMPGELPEPPDEE